MARPKRIPISVAQRIAKEHQQEQVIVVTWDGERTHVVTYGDTKARWVSRFDGNLGHPLGMNGQA